ncbi:AAA family ATPase, partial [Tropicimonas sp.]|uniref:AAA family ATPase n=1 Tax=Tropicimonas sp. TaxID=2067044 RepID=UPI003A866BC9
MNAAVCPACSSALVRGARFCSSCGTRVVERGVAHSRYMTVLFCDLAGSTSLTGAVGDEAMFGIITRYHEICQDATTRHGGFVAKYMGDGVLAYFGYPNTMKNSAVPAVAAALEIVERTRRVRVPGKGRLSASAGVATGWMVVGDANPGTHAAEALAIGGTVNLAARLQAEAGMGRVAVSSETGRRLEAADVTLLPLGARPIRGFAQPVEVWLVNSAESGVRQNAFVGRDEHRSELRAIWETVRSGGTAAAEIRAPGGFGKTALAQSFLAETIDENAVLTLACESHRRDQSFACFRPFVCSLAGLDTGASREAQRELLAEWAPEGAERGLALLCDLEASQPAPVVRNELVAEALVAVLRATVSDVPTVLLLEDAHWLDAASARFFGELPRRLAGSPLMLLMTRRPEGIAVRCPGLVRRDLERMENEHAHRIVEILDPGGILAPAVRAQIVARAAGVPLFLEHMTKAVIERPGGDPASTIPTTMIEALLERFDHLGDTRALVDAAAVLGAEVDIDVLAAMVGKDTAEVSGQIAQLVRRGILTPGGNGAVAFDHALIRDAAMRVLLNSQRLELHRRALDAYSAVAPERLEASPVAAARHLMGAGDHAAAIPKLVEAAQAAMTRGELAEAVRLLEWAESGLGELPATDAARDGLEMLVKFSLGLALVQHRGFGDASVAEAYGRALELCLAGVRRGENEFRIAWGIWAHYMVAGETGRTEHLNQRMEDLARDEPTLEVLAASARSVLACNQGQFDLQEEMVTRVKRLYLPYLHRRQAISYSQDSLELALLFQVHGRYIAGDLPGWEAALQAALEHETFLDLPYLAPYIRIYSRGAFTYALSEVGYRAALEEAVALAAEMAQPFWVTAGNLWLA